MAGKIISIENTRFIFKRNFSGDPERDRFKSSQRKANVVIPDIEQAREMIDAGFNVKLTKPKEGEEEGFVPRYYVSVTVNYDSTWPPKVFLVSGDNDPRPLDEETIGMLDTIPVENVDVILNPREWSPNRYTLYVRTMYVTQGLSDDPFAAKYARRSRKFDPAEEEYPEESLPFN